jgi:processive 1,2-diacylglycerol beta-glucosyltransferase
MRKRRVNMKKIMILYASVGGGHFKAAEGISNFITENYPDYNVHMIDALKYTNKLFDRIVVNSYINMARYSPKMWGNLYNFSEKQYSVANFSNMVNRMLSLKLFNLFKDEDPDIVISTHPFITEMVASLKKHNKTNAKLCVVITDYESHAFWEIKSKYVDMYFVANNGMKYGMMNNGIPENKISVTGIPVNSRFSQKYNRAELLKEFGLEDKKTVLFFGGGEFGLSNIKAFFEALISLKNDIQIVAVAGKNAKIKATFEKLSAKSNKNVLILGYSNKIPELMNLADFVISKPGGLTTTEVLVTSTPFIIINPIPGQEEENANFLLNNGAAARLFNVKKAVPFMEQLLSDDTRIESMKSMQKHLAKPNSTKDICEIALGL